jgi:hypothetical protein
LACGFAGREFRDGVGVDAQARPASRVDRDAESWRQQAGQAGERHDHVPDHGGFPLVVPWLAPPRRVTGAHGGGRARRVAAQPARVSPGPQPLHRGEGRDEFVFQGHDDRKCHRGAVGDRLGAVRQGQPQPGARELAEEIIQAAAVQQGAGDRLLDDLAGRARDWRRRQHAVPGQDAAPDKSATLRDHRPPSASTIIYA